MRNEAFLQALKKSPVIAAAKDEAGLDACLSSPCDVVAVLFGNILDIPDIAAKIADAGRIAIVHLDLIDGLSAAPSAVDYIKNRTRAAGIISTKSVIIKRAKQAGLIAIQRFFLLDSLALSNISKQIRLNNPDFIEVIPGAMPKIIREVTSSLADIPVITGGLIRDPGDVLNALEAGAIAVSVTNCSLIELNKAFITKET
ncbi:MAG: glycerol-3-phosphate responsive antiterminator [Clostridia bacterium]|nr:glycerol-3-phosphate responsive antiterminator [Clostridia bacterium]